MLPVKNAEGIQAEICDSPKIVMHKAVWVLVKLICAQHRRLQAKSLHAEIKKQDLLSFWKYKNQHFCGSATMLY